MDLIISDETLRDGEQQVGVNFSISQKYKLASDILNTGVDQLAIMPWISKYEEQLAKKILKSKIDTNKVYASVMLGKKFIDHAYKLGFKNIILFSSLSERLLGLKNKTMAENLEEAYFFCRYIKGKKMKIFFAGEDATRADLEYLKKFIKTIEIYLDGFIVCDTVGILTPQTTEKLIKKLAGDFNLPIGVHFHNDRSLALKNSLVAVKNGAKIISGTFGGIGERAGNLDLCSFLFSLKKGGTSLQKINYKKIKNVKEKVYFFGGGRPAKPYSTRAFWHESGIHVNCLLKDNLSYNSFPPEKFGKKTRIFFGKLSGVSNYKYLFKEKYSEKQLELIRDRIKDLAYQQNKSFSSKEVKKLIKEDLIKFCAESRS